MSGPGKPPVEVYTPPGCVHCCRARAPLARRGTPFVERSGAGDPQFRVKLAGLV